MGVSNCYRTERNVFKLWLILLLSMENGAEAMKGVHLANRDW
jgi:hypothetical protein